LASKIDKNFGVLKVKRSVPTFIPLDGARLAKNSKGARTKERLGRS
jgi:hypothetical protein